MLAIGKAEEIENIFKVLDAHKISKEAIEGCLYVLARGKAKEIEKIFEVLDAHGVSKETIDGCLYVLAKGKADKITKIFRILENNKIEKQQVEDNFYYLMLSSVNQVKAIFLEGSSFLKQYMKLKGFYNRVISEEEIYKICNDKNIDISELLKSIRGEDFEAIYKETLIRKKRIYIGKSIPIEEDYINKNGGHFLTLAKKVSKNFAYRYRFSDISELESQALEVIITKCGDITYNFYWNPELLERLIYKKTFNYLKINIKAREILYDLSDRKTQEAFTYSDNAKEELDLSAWNIDNQQENILRYMSMYIEEGQTINEAIKSIANILNSDEEEILEEIAKIRKSNNQNEIRKGVGR